MVDKVQVNILLPERLATAIRVVAEVDGEKLSHAAERALENYVESRKLDAEWQSQHDVWAKEQRRKLRAVR